MNTKTKKTPALWLSLVPFVCLILIMLPSVIILGADPQIPLVICTAITTLIGICGLGYSWDDIEKSMIETNAAAMQANFIIMIVGCLVGVWMAGGIVPGLIYYGLQLFTPSVFLAVLPVMCAIIAVSTGSAWTTAGTLGVSAMGVAAGLGIPFPIAAGAIITGAQFGDKLSPLSDSTNLAAGITGTNLFAHVKHMLWTTIPSFLLATGIFAVIGSRYSAEDIDISQIQMICDTLQANFNITPWILLAPASVVLMMILKVPAIPGMVIGTAVGAVFAFLQGNDLGSVISQLVYGFEVVSGNDMVDQLLNRGGMQSMMYTISLVICALAFGGAVKSIGCLDVIIEAVLLRCRTRGSIMTANIFTCIAMNYMAADQYMSIVIPGQMYKGVYKKMNLAPKNLSRVLEDAGTMTSGIVPWSTCGALYYSVLDVSAFVYFPFCFMAFINPLLSAVYAYTGFSIEPLDPSAPIKNRLDDIEEL
ncbi:Na+/H+ antiporter NhaC [Bacilliculturomica massiliensis]|uniref:Na+/H+ antiporter NhaC n=1 Tax=Bacilliculturomica massiliensis TaxID=1917867 RepID=UPI0010312B2E|nr:Na+/H+ antiporter NhaC [Bacilliculturomica massiliensis]